MRALADTDTNAVHDPTHTVIDAVKKALADLHAYPVTDLTDDIEMARDDRPAQVPRRRARLGRRRLSAAGDGGVELAGGMVHQPQAIGEGVGGPGPLRRRGTLVSWGVIAVQDVGIDVSTIGPYERPQLRVDPYGGKRRIVVTNRGKHRTPQQGRQVDVADEAIGEAHSYPSTVQHFDITDTWELLTGHGYLPSPVARL